MIYESTSLYLFTLLAHFLLFVVAPVLLFRRRWPVAAGLVMIASTLLPIAGQTWFTDSEMPGLALLLMLEAPIALIVFVAGVAVAVARTRQRASSGSSALR